MKTILVVEDDALVRNNIQEILINNNYKICSAADGNEGLSLALELIPDLIISDISMPGMDGIEMLMNIRKSSTIGHIPFIFLSAKTDYRQVRNGMIKGANDYLQKPFTLDDLLNSINSVFAKFNVNSPNLNKKDSIPEKYRGNGVAPFPQKRITGFLENEYSMSFLTEEIKEIVNYLSSSLNKYHMLVNRFTRYSNITRALDGDSYSNEAKNHIIYSPKLEIMKYANRTIDNFNRINDLYFELVDIPINFDEVLFSYIIEELVLNAVKYSESGNTILLSGKLSGDQYSLRIVNEGIGLTKEETQNIAAFNHGYAENSIDNKFLTLITIKRILNLHGKKLEINSVPGAFTEIKINFDIAITSDEIYDKNRHTIN